MTDNTHLAPHVRTFFEDHLACQRNFSVNTIQGYRDALKLFLQFAAATRRKPAAELLLADDLVSYGLFCCRGFMVLPDDLLQVLSPVEMPIRS